MGEKLIRPYEISVWEDRLTQIEGSEPAEYKFEETKLAIIGSDTMTGLNKVYDPVFNKKSNGERTLSFALRYKYFDPYSGNDEVVNPFAALLVNERKVKLHYDGKWYEFIVKDHSESSDGLEWTYTCTDAFVLELSKNGYNITFDTELNNNQGTATELARETLKNTDWQVGESDILTQLVAEPLYRATLVSTTGIDIINASKSGEQIPSAGQSIWLFYSYVKNKNGKNVQFIIRDEENRQYTIDDKNVITDTNFRIITELEFKDNGFYYNNNPVVSIGEAETRYQANRLAYSQLTTYDPVMQRTVDRFKIQDEDLEVYRYTDYEYTTSNIVVNFITNGENFNALEDGSLQGWNPYTDQEGGAPVNKLSLITKPEIGTGKSLADIDTLSQIEGFLKYQPNGAKIVDGTKIYNTVYNSGFENHTSIINSIASGDEFVLRWRAGTRNPEITDEKISDVDCLVPEQRIGAIIAKYTADEPTRFGYYYKHIDPKDIILQFEGTPTELNNFIEGGTIQTTEDNKQIYVINNVAQTPSTKYIYKVGETEYLWNGAEGRFVERGTEGSTYLPYYYLKATASKPVSNKVLTDPTEKIGIFIYVTGVNTHTETDEESQESITVVNPVYIQDIQFTRFIPDEDDKTQPAVLGNIPTATSNLKEFYYIKPVEGTAAEDIDTYTSLDALKEEYGYQQDILPIYNEDSEKILTITASKSNCFDILQTIAETFECWVDLVVSHDDEGYITYTDGKPNKYVYLREYVGTENWAGFKYGINLNTIERTINSDEVVTKLIVDLSQSDYVDEGFVSIANAPSNQSGESYILNFDYYYSQGLLNREEAEKDRLKFISDIKEINDELKEKEAHRRDLDKSLTALGSNRNVYTELIASAQDMKNEALGDFYDLTGMSYEDYQKKHGELIADESEDTQEKQLTDEQTIVDIIGELYVSSATINNYGGILTNVDTEYRTIRKELYGSEKYTVQVYVVIDNSDQRHIVVDVSDYLPEFKFKLENDETDYASTVSIKHFDIVSDAHTITFTAPSGYTIVTGAQTINDNEIANFDIEPTEHKKGLIDEIKEVQEEKEALTNNFSNKYSRYIQEGTWNSTDYIDSELYYLDAMQVSNTSAQPTVSYTINVVEVGELEGLEGYTFDAGDKTYVEDTEFFGWSNKDGILTPAREEVIVSEIEWHLDEPDQTVITVQNYKTRFEDLFQRISATVQTVQYNEATYAKTSSIIDADGTLNQNVLLESMNNISGQSYNLTSDGSVVIDGDKVLVRNLNNPANRVIINSEGIRVSSDGGQSWATAIDGQGINIGTVYTGSLNTNEVVIGNRDNPSFRWDKSGISAYRTDGTTTIDGQTVPRYDLQTYVRYDEYGLYGIKDNDTFKAQSLDDVLEKAHFAVTWDGFFIKNSYPGGGRVEITSDNDFRVMNIPEGKAEEQEKIKIGALEWGKDAQNNPIISPDAAGATEAPTLYGIRIKNNDGDVVMKTGDDGNLEVTGTINANAGNFDGLVTVGKDENDASKPYIEIDGRDANDATIRSSRYTQDGASYGWMINADGDAVFNNITARGAIKTAVFEYAEIQAVGGVFIFRPSSTIRSAAVDGNNLVLTVEKPVLFKDGQWCKVSNYTADGEAENPDSSDILLNNGLTHVYQVQRTQGSNEIILLGAAAMVEGQNAVVSSISELIGGALVDMGNKAGTSNYGIGINSSDNTVDLPARAISLFETIVDETKEPKVSYNYRGILGTLPHMTSGVNQSLYQYMEGTQGIYTDNMYIGDNNSYLAFYTENNQKKLRISGADIYLTAADEQSGTTIVDVIDNIEVEGGEGLVLTITSTAGYTFNNSIINTTLNATVYRNGEIVSDIQSEGWKIKWHISGNDIYIKTTDTVIDSEKTYYIYDSVENDYVTVTEPIIQDINQYYEQLINDPIGTTITIGGKDLINVNAILEDISD